jgi:NADH dehydrogenase [ubiquinone] 1 alpha subcomplex assembly factor 5
MAFFDMASISIYATDKGMNQPLFDIEKIRRNRKIAAKHLDGHDFLFERAANRMVDNLMDIQRDFQNILIIGERGADVVQAHFGDEKTITIYDVVDGDNEIPVFEPEQFDCIVALPYLHVVNDVPQFLMAMQSYLKPDGLFLCAFFGGLSLQELRQSIMNAELDYNGGASQHIHPMIDHYQFAALMQKAEFALPVVDFDRVSVTYQKLQSLYDDLHCMGEGNALCGRAQTIAPFKDKVEAQYKTNFYDNGFTATFDILHGIGWKHHDNQQQPAKRGSGTKSLTEIL